MILWSGSLANQHTLQSISDDLSLSAIHASDSSISANVQLLETGIEFLVIDSGCLCLWEVIKLMAISHPVFQKTIKKKKHKKRKITLT